MTRGVSSSVSTSPSLTKGLENITISPANPNDIDELVKIHVDGFRPFVTTFLVNPDPAEQASDIKRELQQQFRDPDILIVKAVKQATTGDSSAAVIVAWAAWKDVKPTTRHDIYVNGTKSVSQRHSSNSTRTPQTQRGTPEPISTFWDSIESEHSKLRNRFLCRRRHIILATLVTAPAHQRHGIGEALTTWGLTKADERRLPCWVDCETVNIPFYERFEFARVGEVTLDLSRWAMGGQGANMGYGMWTLWAGLRLPRDEHGLTSGMA